MVIVLKPGLTQEEVQRVADRVESLGLKAHLVVGKERTIIGAIGDDRLLADHSLESFPGVDFNERILFLKLVVIKLGGSGSMLWPGLVLSSPVIRS
jgi:hypothetical protein